MEKLLFLNNCIYLTLLFNFILDSVLVMTAPAAHWKKSPEKQQEKSLEH